MCCSPPRGICTHACQKTISIASPYWRICRYLMRSQFLLVVLWLVALHSAQHCASSDFVFELKLNFFGILWSFSITFYFSWWKWMMLGLIYPIYRLEQNHSLLHPGSRFGELVHTQKCTSPPPVFSDLALKTVQLGTHVSASSDSGI